MFTHSIQTPSTCNNQPQWYSRSFDVEEKVSKKVSGHGKMGQFEVG